MAVGLLGGTFDPIHMAHLIIAEEVIDRLSLSGVVFIPAARPPHKPDTELTPVGERIAMVKLAIAGNTRLTCSDVETRRPGKSYTIETLKEIRAASEMGERIYLILGADNLSEFFTWKEPEKLLSECELAIVPRPGFDLSDADARIKEKATVIEMPSFGVASRDIRERVRLGRTIRYLVPTAVENYIREKNLYS